VIEKVIAHDVQLIGNSSIDLKHFFRATNVQKADAEGAQSGDSRRYRVNSALK
jgi:hypothetical protein